MCTTRRQAKLAAQGAEPGLHHIWQHRHDKRFCRCPFVGQYVGSDTPEYMHQHDHEWGVPTIDDRIFFERFVLDGAQCGLTWSAILKRREHYKRCFCNWNLRAVAAMPGSGIIRSKPKVRSAIGNARCMLRLQQEHGSFARYLWSFLPQGRPIVNGFTLQSQKPVTSEMAGTISAALKKEGFKFVGPIMMYEVMKATGMVNDHIVSCFRYQEALDISASMEWPW